MGVWGRLTSVFGGSGGGRGGHGGTNGAGMKRGAAGLAPDEPIIVKWPPAQSGKASPRGHGDDGADAAADRSENATSETAPEPSEPTPAPHAEHDIVVPPSSRKLSRDELIAELRANYTEVIDLVRKVNTHLDTQSARAESQDRRAERLLEIAEKIPEAVAVLPQIREQNERLVELSGKMVEAITHLAQATREGQDSIEGAFVEQARAGREAAERAEALLTRSAETQERSAQSLGELGQVIDRGLGASSDRLAGMLGELHTRAGERDAKLADMMARSQRWFILAVVLCVSAVVVAGVAVVLMLM